MHSEGPENFCTLFDCRYLVQGLALYRSLEKWATPFRLWVLCMDETVERYLGILNLKYLQIIPLREIETEQLLSVKSTRSKGEYCWTLTPFIFPATFNRDPSIQRLTYLDADLFFFGPPRVLISEFEESGKDVLITEHAYDPKYDQTATSGRYCVQFLTCKRTRAAAKVYEWWGERCLEWCYARSEDGKFGDQKYLDSWPDLFDPEIHVLMQIEKTLAPWNLHYFSTPPNKKPDPVFYHFHGLRFFQNEIRLWEAYQVGPYARNIYDTYIPVLMELMKMINEHGLSLFYFKYNHSLKKKIARLRDRILGKTKYFRFQISV